MKATANNVLHPIRNPKCNIQIKFDSDFTDSESNLLREIVRKCLEKISK